MTVPKSWRLLISRLSERFIFKYVKHHCLTSRWRLPGVYSTLQMESCLWAAPLAYSAPRGPQGLMRHLAHEAFSECMMSLGGLDGQTLGPANPTRLREVWHTARSTERPQLVPQLPHGPPPSQCLCMAVPPSLPCPTYPPLPLTSLWGNGRPDRAWVYPGRLHQH